MNLFFFSFLSILFIAAIVSAKEESSQQQQRRVSHFQRQAQKQAQGGGGARGRRAASHLRQLDTSSEKMSSKKGMGSKECMTLQYITSIDEIFTEKNAVGEINDAPLYAAVDTVYAVEVGRVHDASTEFPDLACISFGALSFPEEDSEFTSNIFFQGTCESEYFAITGGTRKYECAEGSFVVGGEAERITFDINICIDNACSVFES